MFKCAFTYYGGKSRLAHLYPSPEFRQVIEPFCGGASYSLRYADHDVWINDLDDRVIAIWRFLVEHPDAERWVDELPDVVVKGAHASGVVPDGAPTGLLWLARSEANQGTMGAKGTNDMITSLGVRCWPRLKPRLKFWIPRIRHWRVTRVPAEDIPNIEATWFIDPPYSNAAGTRYIHGLPPDSFDALGRWCRERRGQAIVCANAGETWLPFEPLTESRRGVRSRYQKSETGEALWTRSLA